MFFNSFLSLQVHAYIMENKSDDISVISNLRDLQIKAQKQFQTIATLIQQLDALNIQKRILKGK
jgi:hypothetical protein